MASVRNGHPCSRDRDTLRPDVSRRTPDYLFVGGLVIEVPSTNLRRFSSTPRCMHAVKHSNRSEVGYRVLFTIVLELEYTVLVHSTLCVDRQDVNTRSNRYQPVLNLPGDSIGGDVHNVLDQPGCVVCGPSNARRAAARAAASSCPIDSITICPAHPLASGTGASLLGTRSLTCLVQSPPVTRTRTHIPHTTYASPAHPSPFPGLKRS